MTINIKVELTPEAAVQLDKLNDFLNTPEAQARIAEAARVYYAQRRRQYSNEYFQQARMSMLRRELARIRATRPRWWVNDG